MTSCSFREKITHLPPFITFRHAALDPLKYIRNFYPHPPSLPLQSVIKPTDLCEFQTQCKFLYDMTHLMGRPSVPGGTVGGDTGCGRPTSFSVTCALRAVPWSPVRCTSAIIHDSLARPCRRCDVRDVTQPFTPCPYVTHRPNIVNPPPPSACDVIYEWPQKVTYRILQQMR